MEPVNPEVRPAEQDEAKRRAEALRNLARERDAASTLKAAPPAPPASRAAASKASSSHRWRFWFGPAVAIALVIVVLVSIFAHSASAPTHVVQKSRPGPVVVTLASELIDCPVDLAWSPDLSKIAVVGYAARCAEPDPSYDTGVHEQTFAIYDGPVQPTTTAYIAIYDASHGARLREFSLNRMILQALHDQKLIAPAYTAYLATVDAAPDQYIGLDVTHVLWSPDGTHLFATFTCFLPDGPPVSPEAGSRWPGKVAQGLVILDVNGQSGQISVRLSEPQAAGLVIWNLALGQVAGSMSPSLPFSFQPVATAFAWNRAGSLQAISAAPAIGVVGAPSSGSSHFAVWQPGIVGTTIRSSRSAPNNLSGIAIFATNFAALSPDGRYLAASIGLAGVLSAPPTGAASFSTPSAAILAHYGWQAAPRLPTRDAGLQKAIALASKAGFSGANGDTLTNLASVAWRPDGKFIAVSVKTPANSNALTVFNCATGKKTATLSPPATQANNTNATLSLIAWAPDGKHLAYFDPGSGTLTLWGNSWLPA